MQELDIQLLIHNDSNIVSNAAFCENMHKILQLTLSS